jgi:hypothetical protein
LPELTGENRGAVKKFHRLRNERFRMTLCRDEQAGPDDVAIDQTAAGPTG